MGNQTLSKCFQTTIMNSKIWQIKCHKLNSTKVELLADFPCFECFASNVQEHNGKIRISNYCIELPKNRSCLLPLHQSNHSEYQKRTSMHPVRTSLYKS